MRRRNLCWRSLAPIVLLLLLTSAGSYNAAESAELKSPNNYVQIFDKFKCNLEHLKPVDNANATEGVKSTNTNNANHNHSDSIILQCSKDDISYLRLPVEDFRREEYNGVLELSSLNRKFEHGKFCIASNDSGSHHHQITSSSPDQTTFRIAFCNEQREHQHQHPLTTVNSDSPMLQVRKCCKPNERLDMRSLNGNGTVEYECVEIPTDWRQKEWKPAIFDRTSDDYSKHKDLVNFKHAVYIYGFPNCSGTIRSLNNSKDIWFMLLQDGSVEIGLKFWFKPVWLPVQDNNFCLDEVVDHDPTLGNGTKEIDSHEIYHKNQILLYCQIASFDDYLFHRKLFGGMCVTAAGIVFILLIIYVVIWDKQNLAGWTQFNIFVALFFVVLMEGLRTLFDANALKVHSTPGCVIIAAVAQYFFFALNTTWTVMCFDLFYMFWKLETTSKTVARYKKRLACYLLFSWGLPLVVVCVAFSFTHSSESEAMNKMEGVYAFAQRRCSSPIRKLGFQTQGIMFLLNLLFFLLTTALIWRHRRGINPARKKSRNERHTWRSVTLFLKLVIVMGVTSLSIPVDYFFGSSDPLSNIAIFLRLVHFIPFFAVLFIFGFNEKNVLLISQKYPRAGRYFGIVACTSAATASDTANHSRSGNVNRISEHPSSQT